RRWSIPLRIPPANGYSGIRLLPLNPLPEHPPRRSGRNESFIVDYGHLSRRCSHFHRCHLHCISPPNRHHGNLHEQPLQSDVYRHGRILGDAVPNHGQRHHLNLNRCRWWGSYYSVAISLMVRAPSDFSMSAGAVSPVQISAGSQGTSTIMATALSGFTGTVGLSVSASSPSGLTFTLPSSVSFGSSPQAATLSCGPTAA